MSVSQQGYQVAEDAAAIDITDTLPNELLVKIFRAGAELDTPHSRPCLITYCSVSSRWRSVGQHTPHLWRNIVVPFRQIGYQDPVLWTSVWLERSKGCLFDITLDLPPEHMGLATEMWDVLKPLHSVQLKLLRHIHRMRRFELIGGADASLLGLILRPLRSVKEAPQLEYFRVHFLTKSAELTRMNHIRSSGIAKAPRLRRQTIISAPIQFPLTGLTSLEVHHLLPDESSFRDLAINSPSLEELILPGLRPMLTPSDLILPRIAFPSLRKLVVSFARTGFAPDTSALGLLSPPNLTHLEIHGLYIPDATNTFPDPNTLTNLRTLSLHELAILLPHRSGISLDDTSFYLALPSVKHLQLINTPPQPLFPSEEAVRKPLLRSRSGELKQRSGGMYAALHPGPLPAPRPQAQEIDSRAFIKEMGNPVRLAAATTSSASTPRRYWPNLTAVTLDTIRAKDLQWLCELVASRPEIETVCLSRSARRHLASSLSMWKSEAGDGPSHTNVEVKPPLAARIGSNRHLAAGLGAKKVPWNGGEESLHADFEDGDMDVVRWLEEHVNLLEFQRIDHVQTYS